MNLRAVCLPFFKNCFIWGVGGNPRISIDKENKKNTKIKFKAYLVLDFENGS